MNTPSNRFSTSTSSISTFVITAIAAWLPILAVAQNTDVPYSPNLPNFPNGKPITIVMTFPAGSGVDVVGRQIQEPLQKLLNTNIVIDYKAGAGGNIASELVAKAKPDGHTLVMATSGTHGINAALYKKLPFDVEADFTPIAPLVDVSNVLTINPDVINVKTTKEFVDLIKANPGKYNYASTGNGTGTHLAFAEFNTKAGLNLVHVPYKGGPEAMQAVLKGEVCCIMNQVQTVIAQYKANKVRLLGVTTLKRVPVVSEVPTISESGVPGLVGFTSFIWFGLIGPKNMDASVVNHINTAVRKVLETPDIIQRLTGSGNSIRLESPEQFKATVKTDRVRWAEVVKAAGATID
jgi:tripartite-type tricarboxylate transporter receptor subunit TctC